MTDLLFGVNVSTSAGPGTDPVGDAVHAEELGFDFISANDHPCGTEPTHEVWTMLTWIAAQTSHVGIATRVLGVPYRPPAMVAKMAATLDHLSRGRLVLGLGGGYSDEEFRAFGLSVPTPREKIVGLEDAIRIARGLWSEPDFTFEGARYRTDRANIEPKPGRPIPIWLGTYGRRALGLTGRLADGWIPSFGFAPPQEATAMLERIVAAARDAGRDPAAIRAVYNVEVRVGGGQDEDPGVVSGSPAQVAERLRGFLRLGFRGVNFVPSGPDPRAQRERLAREVIPAVRAA
jgi:alkanesulfonate monooxygenase SsuD/methylene tetrahydromethanopterin reductase-like flavin-dependent oxidoreductase (luciferase family)